MRLAITLSMKTNAILPATEHATPTTCCAACGTTDQLRGIALSAGRWLCSSCQPALKATVCGCTRANAYRHTPSEGFTCRHRNQV